MKIGIVTVPYITNDTTQLYAQQTLISLKSSNHDLFNVAVVNYWRDKDESLLSPYYDHIIINDVNVLARAWNKGIEYALEQGADYVIVPNLDIIAREDTVDNLVDIAEEYSDGVIWCGHQVDDKENLILHKPKRIVSKTLQRYSFSFFMVNERLFKEVKKFNEVFKPCYFEDWEMQLYCNYLRKPIYRTPYALFFHYQGATKLTDTNTYEKVNAHFERNRKIYEKIESMVAKKM